MMNFRISGVTLASILILGCTTHQYNETQELTDPLESFNRSMFNFNYDIIDPYVMKPTAIAWRHYIPKPVHDGLNNFFTNLEEPTTTVNYLIEGKPYKAIVHFNRFFINTLFGIGGLIDLASITNPKLEKTAQRHFGNTLGNYTIGYGPYLHLPAYGSFTLREDLGDMLDNLFPPLNYLTWWMFVGKLLLGALENRAQLLESDGLLYSSQDPYAMIRTAYFQQHDFILNEGTLIEQENPNATEIQNDIDSIDAMSSALINHTTFYNKLNHEELYQKVLLDYVSIGYK